MKTIKQPTHSHCRGLSWIGRRMVGIGGEHTGGQRTDDGGQTTPSRCSMQYCGVHTPCAASGGAIAAERPHPMRL